MPKKKTRKQKEKAKLRRSKQLEIISRKNQEELTDEPAYKFTPKGADSTLSPTLSPQTVTESNIGSISSDLKIVVILVVVFVLLLITLVVVENQYNYLSPLSEKLMNFLLQR